MLNPRGILEVVDDPEGLFAGKPCSYRFVSYTKYVTDSEL